MQVRMKVNKSVVGPHDPAVTVGSSPAVGIAWDPGDIIVVSESAAERYERCGIASRCPEDDRTATVTASEMAVLHNERARGRASRTK